ncbi:UDP-N-acetylmuramate dehydrogenase [Arachidicoccus ginsenosidivorans]|uniref:UDP-N-acetylenolpyruvoylglucosamine reductase n=1 Tax=Arachidicoccus ginsenosidivorans TaxID=496057 RepID=A0A5B8VNR8_9BACT|nr:UDP-N-acetylmuramate dehydrogenase [Arachidicoccus ginsenosidivorans]QEC72863.1 UDP-N-acetylmuramate dehydrogenase [Arachidicoccus ginsenosidivorans]
MQLTENFNIQPYNTFGISATVSEFQAFDNVAALSTILKKHANTPLYVLGGGSNVLFTGDYEGLILKNNLKGIQLLKQDQKYYYIKVAAGEPWHPFVQYCVQHGYPGLENLSLIPGLAGASPMQNIGAYGVEIKDHFFELEAMRISDQTIRQFTNADCQFGYRESIFKKALKGQFIILSVTFRLPKKPVLHLEYGAIKEELNNAGITLNKTQPSIKDISEAVIRIRQRKLPDPKEIGNAGSFFKNPSIPLEQFEALKALYPTVPAYSLPPENALAATHIKVAAGFLIESCGWKGYRMGDAGVHKNQALVLVNYGQATGSEILALSQRIIESVVDKFGIHLEREVNII